MKKLIVLGLCCGATVVAFAASPAGLNKAEMAKERAAGAVTSTYAGGEDLPQVTPRPGQTEEEALYGYLKGAGREIPAWLTQRLFPLEGSGGAADRNGGDTYATATPITFAPGGTYVDAGTTVGFVNNYDYAVAPVTCNTSFFGSSFNGPDAVYTFTLPAAYEVSVSTCNAATWDSCLGIVNSAGTLVAVNDDGSGCANWSSLIPPCCLPAGTYFIIVDAYGSASGPYTMTVNFGTQPCGVVNPCDTFNANLTNITLPYTGSGTNVGAPNVLGSTAGDVGYVFTLTEASELTFTSCMTGTNYDSDSYLYSGNPCAGGTQLLYNDGNSGCTYAAWATEWTQTCTTPVPAGTYTLVMSGYSSLSGNYAFTLSSASCACPPVTCVGTPESEPNGSAAEADLIACGDTVCGTTFTQGDTLRDTDWFQLNLAGDAIVTANLDVQAFNGIIYLVASDGATLLGSADAAGFCADETFTSQCLQQGTYYLVIAHNAFSGVNTPTNYGLSVSCQGCTWVDPCAGLASLECGGTYSGDTTGAPNYVGNPAPDNFILFTNTGGTNVVTFTLCNGGSTWDTYLRLYDMCPTNPSATQLALNDDSCGLQSLMTATLNDGTYYVVVEGFSSGFGPYTLDISCVPYVPPTYTTCQTVVQPTEAWNFGTSEFDIAGGTNYLRAERFGSVVGGISAVDFEGLDLSYSAGWIECDEEPMPFTISFFDVFMAPVASYTPTLSGTATQLYGTFQAKAWHFDLPAPLFLSEGYLAIQGAGSNVCSFLWGVSILGVDNSSKLSVNGGPWTNATFDLNYCLTTVQPCDPPAAPVITMSGGDAYLSWTAAAGAIYYDVYGATDGYGTYTLVGSSPTTSFVDVGAQALGRKFYKVVSICN